MNVLNIFPNKPLILRVRSTNLLKTLWEKEKLPVTSNSSFLPQCFLPFWRTFCHFPQIQNCCLQTFSLEESKICLLGKGKEWLVNLACSYEWVKP